MFKKIIQYTDALDICSILNGLVFFAPVSLLVRTSAGVSIQQFFLLQAIVTCVTFLTEIPSGKLTDIIGYKNTLVCYQVFLLCARITLFIDYSRVKTPLVHKISTTWPVEKHHQSNV